MSKIKHQRLISGVAIKPLRVITDGRGRLMEILRCDDKIFEKFGQCYFTTAYPQVVKAWHYHKKQDDHFTCVQGKILLVLYDARKNSKTAGTLNEFILSLDNPLLIKIPRLVYHGFKAVSPEEAMVINIPTKAYDPAHQDEYRLEPDDPGINYSWSSPR